MLMLMRRMCSTRRSGSVDGRAPFSAGSEGGGARSADTSVEYDTSRACRSVCSATVRSAAVRRELGGANSGAEARADLRRGRTSP